MAGLVTWLVLELFLKIRRIERRNARLREWELAREAESVLRQLEERERQLQEQETQSRTQFELHIARIRELERTLQNVDDYRRSAETMIMELEEENARQSERFTEEMTRTNRQKQILQAEFERYRTASGKDKAGASAALETAISPPFANTFEKKIFMSVSSSPKAQQGMWRVVGNFDVAAGKGGSRFVDCLVIGKDCLTVVEAKNYTGTIDAEGSLGKFPLAVD